MRVEGAFFAEKVTERPDGRLDVEGLRELLGQSLDGCRSVGKDPKQSADVVQLVDIALLRRQDHGSAADLSPREIGLSHWCHGDIKTKAILQGKAGAATLATRDGKQGDRQSSERTLYSGLKLF